MFIFLHSLLPGGQKNAGASGYLKANFELLVALASLMGKESSETRAKTLLLKAALEKLGVTYAICLIGRAYVATSAKASDCWSQCTFREKYDCLSLHDQEWMDFTKVNEGLRAGHHCGPLDQGR